jgi:tetraacyldisaccharide 4'-kinase
VTRARRVFANTYRSKLPVICIGNFTAGGAGKTPAAIAVAHILRSAGERPIFLTRGYGGTIKGPHLVNPGSDKAHGVGDEPLLLARVAPTIVAADRAQGARLAESQDASVIIMDDGFQNPGLAKTLSLIVIDGVLGLGNEHVIPAGPLRASLGFQLAQADGLILVGEGDAAGRVHALAKRALLPVLSAEIMPDRDGAWLKDKPLVAFAGIGNPDKFFRTVEDLGGKLLERMPYPDHHPYTQQDALKLLGLASSNDACLVTTEKDLVRIEGGAELQKLKEATRALPVRLRFKEEKAAKEIILRVIGPA